MNGHRQLQDSSAAESYPIPMATLAGPSTQKKKRAQPADDPDAVEVIALSPKTLTTTNRFICEVCKKGFQREQNLQLHKRGHNLPWELKQRSTSNEVKRKVYVCPVPTCVHHNPSRALGDLTGVKKHFARKHGEKKWECEKCSKRYAVQSDWKSHLKICGTKEYTCDCGTIFSRRDSFMTHRAFCNAMAEAKVTNPTSLSDITSQLFGLSSMANGDDFSAFLPTANHNVVGCSFHGEGNNNHQAHPAPNKLIFNGVVSQDQVPSDQLTDHSFLSNITARRFHYGSPADDNNHSNNSSRSTHFSSSDLVLKFKGNEVGGCLGSGYQGSSIGLCSSENFMSDPVSSHSLFSNASSASAHLSATALLQKAAQVGSSCPIIGSNSLLTTFGSSLSTWKHDTSFVLGSGGSTTSSMFGVLPKGLSAYNDNFQLDNNFCSGEYGDRKPNFVKLSEEEYSKEQPKSLTRDFLGVGLIVSQMGGGFSQNDFLQHQQQGHHQMSSNISIKGDSKHQWKTL